MYPPRTELVLGAQAAEGAAESVLEHTNGIAEPEELTADQLMRALRIVDGGESGFAKVRSTLEELLWEAEERS